MKSVAPRKDEGKEYPHRAGSARPPLPSCPPFYRPHLPPSPEGPGNYPPHQCVPHEGKDRRGGPRVAKNNLISGALGSFHSHNFPILFHRTLAFPLHVGHLAMRWKRVCRSTVSQHQHVSSSIVPTLWRYGPVLAWPERNWLQRPACCFLLLRRGWRRRPRHRGVCTGARRERCP